MQNKVKKNLLNVISKKTAMKNLAVLFSFILPVFILYLSYPNSFLITWKGRALYVIFLWLACLEFALAWKKLALITPKQFKWTRAFAAVMLMIGPTLYVLAISYTELEQLIIELGRFLGVPFGGKYGNWFLTESWPLSFEYLLFAVFFSASILFIYKIEGIKKLLIPLFFLWAIAAFYMIDTFFPYGTVWMLQIFVPFTARSSAGILNWMGYKSVTMNFIDSFYGPGTILVVIQNTSIFSVAVFWPSAGVHSLFIYTLTILLFIKYAPFSPQRKIIYASIPRKLKFMAKSKRISSLLERKSFHTTIMAAETLFVNVLRMIPLFVIVVIGAVGTFMANILRIATICIIGLKDESAAKHFHDYYGEFFFISWMLIYLAIIGFGPKIAAKILRIKEAPQVK